jgi:hypothetical protein
MLVAAIDWQGGINNAWNAVANFVPKLIACLVILLIGYLVAKAIEKILDRILQRVGFDRLVERGGIKRALATSKYDAASILGRIVFYAVMLVVLSMAFGVFGPNPVSVYLAAAIAYLPKVFVAILIIVIAAAIAAGVRTLIVNTIGALSYGRFLAGAAATVVVALGVIAALNVLEIAPAVVNAVLYATLAAIAGVVIVAVGGGGIIPMRQRWEAALARYDEEKPRIQQQVAAAPSVREQASQAAADVDLRSDGRHTAPASTPSRPASPPPVAPPPAPPGSSWQ